MRDDTVKAVEVCSLKIEKVRKGHRHHAMMESLGERVNIVCLYYFFIACKHGTRQLCFPQPFATVGTLL